jgi:asparagine synthase (glutamine-hydrolysing)
MCGIAGIYSKIPIDNPNRLISMRDTMTHRGPDDAGVWWSSDMRLGLAHRRLAIIDLSPSGHQPMKTTSGDLCIVFNGEIYNFVELRRELMEKGHIFHSKSDTEVLLAAYREWGTNCLSRLNGMFVFALYDSRKRQLFIARDRAGEKPLFYALIGDTFLFASELKALMADPALPRTIDPESLDCYLTMGFVPGERCMLRGVKKLPPAHALQFDLNGGQTRVWQYWHVPELNTLATGELADEGALLNELDALLEDAVQRQLVADVPVGVLLSGGVDSSLITAMAARSAQKVKTFTVRFPGYNQYDETEHARLIARHFGTEHIELEATAIPIDILPMLARQFDEPMVDSSMIPTYLVSRLIREHCTVALGGDGGDELFAGYSHYSRLLWMQHNLGWIPQKIRFLAEKSADYFLPVGFRGRNWLQCMGCNLETGVPLIASYFDRNTRRELLKGYEYQDLAGKNYWEKSTSKVPDLLYRATRMDFENYLAEDILVKVDRASMLNSLEIRAPFLDYRLIEFAFGKVPSQLKATTTSRKILLKKLTTRLLPPEFDKNRKQGFSIPLASWLQSGPWQELFWQVLMGSESSPFDRTVVGKLLDGQAKGWVNGERLFALVLFELWRHEYNVSM